MVHNKNLYQNVDKTIKTKNALLHISFHIKHTNNKFCFILRVKDNWKSVICKGLTKNLILWKLIKLFLEGWWKSCFQQIVITIMMCEYLFMNKKGLLSLRNGQSLFWLLNLLLRPFALLKPFGLLMLMFHERSNKLSICME